MGFNKLSGVEDPAPEDFVCVSSEGKEAVVQNQSKDNYGMKFSDHNLPLTVTG